MNIQGNDNPQADVFTSDDLAAIEQARLDQEAQDAADQAAEAAAQAPAAAPAAAPTPAPAAPAAAPAAAAPAAASPAPAAPAAPAAAPAASAAPAAAAPPPHHLHAALRAERTRADRLAAENAALKAGTAAPPAPKKPTAAEIEEVAAFDPTVGAYVRELERANQELAAKAATAPAAPAPDFIPVKFDAQTQAVIDAVPDLFNMQYNPDQTAFKLAVAEDTALRLLPAWKGKSDVEILTEAARRASERLGLSTGTSTTTPTDAERALAAIAAAAAPAPAVAIGDLGGGANPSNELPDYNKMSDAEIMASLPVT